jgi:sarcosine oxidase gamma subunit
MKIHDADRKTVRECLDRDFAPLIDSGPLSKAIARLQELSALVPEGQEGMLEVDPDGEWTLFYVRPETDQEVTQRLVRERAWAATVEQSERKVLAALKAKYES